MSLRWNTERPVTLREHGGASVLVGNRGINCEPPLTRHRKQNVSRNRNVYFTLSRRFRNVQLSRMTDAGDFT